MKKLVRTNLTNTPNRRGTKDLNIQFYSHDKNNAGFEFVIKNETDLSQYTAKVLFKFRDSNSTWQANGTIEGNVVKVSFNTDLIARYEEVLGFLFLDSDSDSLDVFKFKFNVVLSEIDKGEAEKRRIKHVENISSFELVTRAELKEELSRLQINGIDLSDYLTTKIANETYALKNEIPNINGFVTIGDLTEAKKSVVEEINKLGYAKTTEVPAAYDDSDLKNRVKVLEDRPTTASTSYDDSEVNRRLTVLEARPAGTSYDDSKLVERVKKIEDKPEIDTSHFLTEEILAEKHFISASDVEQTYLKKVDVPTPVNT
uniref:BppU family phage baseplate upper protein n=1 Tax=uncultured Gemella sp. TaxID=254352 RepID=UPI0025FE0FB6